MTTQTLSGSDRPKRLRFFLTSLGIGMLGLLSLFGAAAVFVSHLLFRYDIVDFAAIPVLLSAGIWVHALGALVALVGIFIRSERRLLCGLALVMNLIPPSVAAALFFAGLVLMG